MKEFDWIHRYFAPLAAPEGLGLSDDVALFSPKPDKELVFTKDAITAGIHFFADDAPEAIAQKLLRVNLSDLAAKGATPRGYMIALFLPNDTKEAWLEAFVTGLASDQARYGIRLFGGDTCRTEGPFSASLTAIGEIDKGQLLYRHGAQIGDIICMTGGVGNAYLGLKIRKGELAANDYLLDKYLYPKPQLHVGKALLGRATSCIDISDGLVQDAGHLATASRVQFTINTKQLTFSREAREYLNQDAALLEKLLTGGDDYELLFTAPPESKDELIRLSEQLEVTITAIGTVGEGKGVKVLNAEGEAIEFKQGGWQHF